MKILFMFFYYSLFPQQYAFESFAITHEPPLVVICRILFPNKTPKLLTATGDNLVIDVPSPICP
jgi:hypothetical protein